MKTRKTEQNARENYKKVYFLMIVVSTILFLTAIGCQKKVDTSLKAQPSIVEYTCISDSDSDKSFYVILKNYHGVYWETVIEGVSKAANKILQQMSEARTQLFHIEVFRVCRDGIL